MTGFYQKIIAFVMSIIMIPTGSLFVFLQKFDKREKFNSIFDEGIHEIARLSSRTPMSMLRVSLSRSPM